MEKRSKTPARLSYLPAIDFNALKPPAGYVPGRIRGDYGFANEFVAKQTEIDQLNQMMRLPARRTEKSSSNTEETAGIALKSGAIDFKRLHPFEMNASRLQLGISEPDFLGLLYEYENEHCVFNANGELQEFHK